MNTIVIGLSGGMDSSTLLGSLLGKGNSVHCCIFKYGSKHNYHEIRAASEIIEYYNLNGYSDKIHRHDFNLSSILGSLDSALIGDDRDVPEGHFEDEVMKQTVVPGRNLLFASTMASVAENIGADKVALGVHAGDHFIYPDCRPEFIRSLNTTIYLSTDGQVGVTAPWTKKTKADILNVGYNLDPPVPYYLTRTCYKSQANSCGQCGACVERLEAFKKTNHSDPILYE